MGTYGDAGNQLDNDLAKLVRSVTDLSGSVTALSSGLQGANDAISQLTTATKANTDAISALNTQLKAQDARITKLEAATKPPDPVKPPTIVCNPPVMTPPASEPTGANIVSITTLGTGDMTKKMDMLAAGKELSLPAGTFSDPDFNRPANYPVYCVYWGAKPAAVHGSGADKTIIQATPNSLTQGYKKLDTIVTPDTNPYRVLRVDKATVVEDVQIKGTMQGTSAKTGKPYSYHGIQFFGTVNPTIRRCKVPDIPGCAGVPPDETFSIEAYKCSGTFSVEDCILDAPSMEGSSAVTINGTGGALGVSLKRIRVTGHPNGSGWTTFNVSLTSFLAEDFYTDGSLCGLNFEQVIVNGGAKVNNAKDSGIVITRQETKNPSDHSYKPGVYSHLAIDSSTAGGGVSNRIDIHDPIGIDANNPYGITISASYGFASVPSGPQAQRGADIHLWMGNTERNDLILWRRTSGAA